MFRILFLLVFSLLFVRCNNGDSSGSDKNASTVTGTAPEPQSLSYSILNAFPHDTAAFTQDWSYIKAICMKVRAC
jgi:glutamine cyclotransferase